MDRFLSSITELGLRRLYKFILKRIIGDYLESELLIEQLEVSSRTGLVTLTDLRLNCDVINDEHLGSTSPFKLVSFTIAKLEVVISYVAVLHDGCRFRASGVEIIMEPSSSPSSSVCTEQDMDPTTPTTVSPNTSKPTTTSRKEHSQSSSTTSGPVLQSEEGQQGLDFIANWIEVVLARLEVSVEDVRVVVRGETPKPQSQPQPQSQAQSRHTADTRRSRSNSAGRGVSSSTTNPPPPPPPPPTLIFVLSRATFYNSNPRLPSNRTSTVASSVRMTQSAVGLGASTALSSYGSTKKVKTTPYVNVQCCCTPSQHITTQHITTQHNIIQYNTTQHNTLSYC